ncbi:Protein kinase domain [Trypanosoma vivax]|uniref:Putative tyrosine protein kinase n=1 Tax=Trypanosoma vivax (strain Y486) TaxID=1055687 RepID=G0U7P0_TRYVY|nr:Protein kinase domain [Trypanosoma vivax]CCC51898.1 putative tyrosine protein kinase [Trypanosoma vivax Y486]
MLKGRYIVKNVLGNGTYGQVLRCSDLITGAEVAVKIAQRDPAYRRSAQNEIRVLQLLGQTEESLNMLDFFEEDGHLCIVLELLQANFYELLRESGFQPLPLHAVRVSVERVLKALVALHAVGYMHCDIKPENVMLRRTRPDCSEGRDYRSTCLIDFGAVRTFHENTYYDIQSLWYRAPEVILGVPYTPYIDAWSVGCLLFELYTGRPLFHGKSPQEVFDGISRIVGLPPVETMIMGVNFPMLRIAQRRDTICAERNLKSLITKYRSASTGIKKTYQSAVDEEAVVDLMCRLLEPNEKRRLSCVEALKHPFFRADRLVCKQRSATRSIFPERSLAPLATPHCSVTSDMPPPISGVRAGKCPGFSSQTAKDQQFLVHQNKHEQYPPVRYANSSMVSLLNVGDPSGTATQIQQPSLASGIAATPSHPYLPRVAYGRSHSPLMPTPYHFQYNQKVRAQQSPYSDPSSRVGAGVVVQPACFISPTTEASIGCYEVGFNSTMHPQQPDPSQVVPVVSCDGRRTDGCRPMNRPESDVLMYKVLLSAPPGALVYVSS